jgi:hypothetical protein
MQALLLHFRQHGKKAIEKVAREQTPRRATSRYTKACGMSVTITGTD